MKIAIYPGSFDPLTNGHLDIIKRASKMFDKLVIAVLKNNKKNALFSIEERVDILKKLTIDIKNVEVDFFDGLLIDFAREKNAIVIVRGLRAITDFDYELQLAQTNKVIANELETIFLTTNLKYSYLSSSIVKEIASFGGDISAFVHEDVAKKTIEKIKEKNRDVQNIRCN